MLIVRIVDRSASNELKFNKETEFIPILGLVSAQLNSLQGSESKSDKAEVTAEDVQDNHHPALLALLAEELSVKAEEIHDFEL